MKQDNDKYQYQQLEVYKETLELKHLKQKTIVINLLIFLLGLVVTYFLIRLNSSLFDLFSVIILFIILLIVNIAFYSYDEDHFNNLKIAMYVTTIGIYAISLVLIFKFQTPSIFTSLFLAYALTSIYQDYKSMILSNVTLFLTGTLLVLRFPTIFEIVGSNETQTFFVLVFLIVFVLLLTLSSFILIKRKTFFYNQLAQIKESEVRNMDLLMEIEKVKTSHDMDYENYYRALNRFSRELSKKIGIENIFKRKIQILKELKTKSIQDLANKYPDYSVDELTSLSNMELEVHKKMKMIGLKASKSYGIEVTRKEIFSESQFKSFKHFGDDNYTKIISFVVFYCLLKIDKPYLKELSEKQVKDMLFNSEYYYRIDRDVINIYLENNEVFDTIVNDILKGSW